MDQSCKRIGHSMAGRLALDLAEVVSPPASPALASVLPGKLGHFGGHHVPTRCGINASLVDVGQRESERRELWALDGAHKALKCVDDFSGRRRPNGADFNNLIVEVRHVLVTRRFQIHDKDVRHVRLRFWGWQLLSYSWPGKAGSVGKLRSSCGQPMGRHSLSTACP